jgi:zinc transport system substrate-binding protein
VLLAAVPACSSDQSAERTIVASVYPLAFVAEQVTGPEWTVIDLTPPGLEAHDLDLTLEQRAEIQSADMVLYLGQIGFQPQVEAAVKEAGGEIVSMADEAEGLGTVPRRDPHLWFEIDAMATVMSEAWFVQPTLVENPSILQDLSDEFLALRRRFDRVLDPRSCTYHTAIVSHEAFGYLLEERGFDQLGLSGTAPEAEPSLSRLERSRALIAEGKANAVFFDEHEDARDLAESFASDTGVRALPLSTLESKPESGDYFTVMENNLRSLREGLGCQ